MTSNSLIIKFVDKRHLHQFLHVGELHFGSTQQYREIEEVHGNTGIGDVHEGDYHPDLNITGPNKVDIKLPSQLHFHRPANIFCTTQIRPLVDTTSQINLDVIEGMYKSLVADTDYPKQIIIFNDYNVIHDKIAHFRIKLATVSKFFGP